ncbi:MAG: hypothetical protein ISS32_00090 [Candidatus Omnitrophica bacterium]|nr:hypothetical protein [Candidatus Omnitrophota bacterium]MBL7210170.1 hypothetical protein [Candidatus Omnitrophota bacterium]
MTTKKDILGLHKKQLALDIDVIRLAIQHKAVKGSEAESAFKRLLRKHLPQRYNLLSGFVVNADRISRQHDIIVYDDFMNAPMFLGDSSGLFLGGSVYGVVEVTIARLNTAKLKDDLGKIAQLRKIFPENKVPFQKVVSCPIIDQDKVKEEVSNSLSSGYCIEDIWPEIKETCFSKEGAYVEDILQINSCDSSYDKQVFADIFRRHGSLSKKYIVKEKTIYSTPPPRTFLCALDGTAYKSVEALAKAVKKLTKEYGAHVHGLLVLNEKGDDWLISTRAHEDYDVEIKTKNAFFEFLEAMKRDFQGMLVGKLPAAEEKESVR